MTKEGMTHRVPDGWRYHVWSKHQLWMEPFRKTPHSCSIPHLIES